MPSALPPISTLRQHLDWTLSQGQLKTGGGNDKDGATSVLVFNRPKSAGGDGGRGDGETEDGQYLSNPTTFAAVTHLAISFFSLSCHLQDVEASYYRRTSRRGRQVPAT